MLATAWEDRQLPDPKRKEHPNGCSFSFQKPYLPIPHYPPRFRRSLKPSDARSSEPREELLGEQRSASFFVTHGEDRQLPGTKENDQPNGWSFSFPMPPSATCLQCLSKLASAACVPRKKQKAWEREGSGTMTEENHKVKIPHAFFLRAKRRKPFGKATGMGG